jgi:hypothetical protein
MAYGPLKNLVGAATDSSAATALATTATTVYTAPASKSVEIASVILHNTGTSSQTVTLFVGGTGATSQMLKLTLAANDTFEFAPKVPIVIQPNATPQVLAGSTTTGSTVNIWLYGREEV